MTLPESVRALSEAATPGPWQAYIAYSGESGLPDEVGLYAGAKTTHGMENTIISDFVSRSENIMADLEFIVALVNAYRSGELVERATVQEKEAT